MSLLFFTLLIHQLYSQRNLEQQYLIAYSNQTEQVYFRFWNHQVGHDELIPCRLSLEWSCDTQLLHFIGCQNTEKEQLKCIFQNPNQHQEDQLISIEIDFQKNNLNQTHLILDTNRNLQHTVFTDADMESVLNIGTVAVMRWKYNTDNSFDMIFEWNDMSWLGVGFCPTMDDCDMLVLTQSNSQVYALDTWSTGHRYPTTDSHDDINVVSYDGPFGSGLELYQGMKGTAFVGGTGILPFIDLLDHLLLKSIFAAIKQKDQSIANQIFSKNDQLGDEFEFTMFATFLNEEDFIGKDWIRELYRINQENGLKLFNMKIRYSNGKLDEVIPAFRKRFNAEFVKNELKDEQRQIYICGPPGMNSSLVGIFNTINYDANKVMIV